MEMDSKKPNDEKVLEKSWLVLLLGFCAIFIVPMAGFVTSLLRRLLDPESVNPNRTILAEAGFLSFLLSSIFSILAITRGIRSIKQGNKSWIVWIGIILAILVLAFWTFMVIGELIYPH